MSSLQIKVEQLANPDESPNDPLGRKDDRSPVSMPANQQQMFSSLAILNQAPSTVDSRMEQVSNSPVHEVNSPAHEDNDEAEVAAILLETKTLG